MLGHIQNDPINLISLLQHASRWHPEQEVVSHTVEGPIHRQNYAQTMQRTTKVASRLSDYGIVIGDRVGTLGWNTYRHLETWYAISGQGAICHTINPRLFPEQISFIINHAEDRVLFVDLSFVELIAGLLPELPSVEAIVIMTDEEHMPDTSAISIPVHCYESFLDQGSDEFSWPILEDDTGSSLCYTSGTTGDPKGVLYTHRGNILHAYAACGADVWSLSSRDSLLMIVPMFHANSWGLAYSGPMAGAKLVLPGPHMDGKSVHNLLETEAVNKAAAVPTVWNMLIAYLNESGSKLESLEEVTIGGAAVPPSMIEEFDTKYDVNVLHAWGMTELTPLGTFNRPKPFMDDQNAEENFKVRLKQGRVPYGIDMKIVDDEGTLLPHDGTSFGRLMVKGPWTIERYYKSETSALEDGWFDTGDIATIDEQGYMQITDRSKDVIKSGGEWISSVDIENAAVAMSTIEIAACIAAKHPKWDERPILLVKTVAGEAPTEEDILAHLETQFAKWQLPDAIIYVDDIPLTATGKIDKKPLRARYENTLLD
jgi:acyl-CoA synthetase (AMP-forming)/AMP-acid ligase II